MTHRRLRYATAVLTLAGLLIVVDASPAAACSCVFGAKGAVAHVEAIFSGSVVEDESDPANHEYLFEVDRVFEGDVHERQWVDSGRESPGCSTTFDATVPHVVFGYGTDPLTTDQCMQSIPEDETAALLGRGSLPIPGTSPAFGDSPSWRIFAGIAVAVGATAALLALASRRLRQHVTD